MATLAIIDSPITPMNSNRKLLPLSEIISDPIRWEWQDRIAEGALSSLLGNPSEGKSAIGNDLIARVTTGKPMPDCTEPRTPAGVVLLPAEDVLAGTVRPNLEAAGADLERIYVHDKARFGGSPLVLPDDQPIIEEAVASVGARLIVIDPLSAFLKGNVNSERNVRSVLGGLAAFAERAATAVLFTSHLNKGTTENPLYRGSGSIGIIASVRSALLVGRDPSSNDPYRRVLVQSKCNLGNAPGLAYRTVKRGNAISVEWLGPSTCTAQDLMSPGRHDAPALQEAIDVLRSLLSEEPVWSAEVIKLAAQAGVAKRTLDRARRVLGVIARKRGNGRGSSWIWQLPGAESEADVPGPSRVADRSRASSHDGDHDWAEHRRQNGTVNESDEFLGLRRVSRLNGGTDQ